jgi:hypothetical protein
LAGPPRRSVVSGASGASTAADIAPQGSQAPA